MHRHLSNFVSRVPLQNLATLEAPDDVICVDDDVSHDHDRPISRELLRFPMPVLAINPSSPQILALPQARNVPAFWLLCSLTGCGPLHPHTHTHTPPRIETLQKLVVADKLLPACHLVEMMDASACGLSYAMGSEFSSVFQICIIQVLEIFHVSVSTSICWEASFDMSA